MQVLKTDKMNHLMMQHMNHCGDEATGDKAYLDGFVDGCMSIEGNTRDVCESATDG